MALKPSQDGRALCVVQDRQAAERTRRVGHRGGQQPDQPLPDGLNGAAVEQVGRVFQHAGEPRGLAGGRALFRECDRQVELRGRGRNRMRLDREARKREPGPRPVGRLERQHHLEQRMPRQRARRIEHLHQTLERQLRMRIGRKVPAAHTADQLAEARIARRVGAQHQRVDEEPDQFVQRRVHPARDRAAQRDVGSSAKPRQQAREPRLQHHEQARARRPRQCRQPAVQFGVDAERHMPAAVARHRRTRPVGRKLDLLRKLTQSLLPELQLPRDRAVGFSLFAQNRLLPQRVVGVLHRQATAARLVCPPVAPGTAPPGPAAADAATSRRPRCDAAPAAARGRPPQHRMKSPAHRDAPAAEAPAPGRTRGPPLTQAPTQALLP